MNDSVLSRVAVCSWSLQPTSPQDLAQKIEQTGVRRVQLALDPLRETPDVWGDTAEVFQQAGLTIASGMFGCVGEDYTTLESIRKTGGLTPEHTFEQNLKNAKASALTAAKLGIKYITFHAGFIPHDPNAPEYSVMLNRIRQVAAAFGEQGVVVGLETGQETAPDLAGVLTKLNSPNIGVNFDPANMILYDKGNPIEALKLLGRWVRNVHIKDARRTKVPGTWGTEEVAGTGEVDWPKFFATLREIKFAGDWVIEREAGTQRIADIKTARQMLEKIAA
jgi:sugar phosphate isomerase/epimerase